MQGASEETLAAIERGDLDAAGLDPKERALLNVVETITRHAYRVTDEQIQRLRDLGWTEPEIAEAVYITALFAFFNRVADAFGIVSEGYRSGEAKVSEKHLTGERWTSESRS